MTFNVTTTAADRPFVTLNCNVNGPGVYSGNVGFFPDYPWAQEFTLSNGCGPAELATARPLSNSSVDGTSSTTLKTLSFHSTVITLPVSAAR